MLRPALPLLLAAAAVPGLCGQAKLQLAPVTDPHSYGNPQEIRVSHIALDLSVDFTKKALSGTAMLSVKHEKVGATKLVLDTHGLVIEKISAGTGKLLQPAPFKLGAEDKILGAPLEIELPLDATTVQIVYRTQPSAGGLQWLDPSMTAGKKEPYLFSQSESIYGRTWIPMQDSPSVRVTYTAVIHTPKNLRAVMSAEQDLSNRRTGTYFFKMDKPIPTYLIALAVGDISFHPLGRRAGVWSEPSMLSKAAWELADTEKMIEAAEKLYGPYRWGRYDILVLPPSFPYGGMENPRLTFATPTILAGDRSLVSLVAHELAHSWSGNLVTNATWGDVWLNEGFTTYVERRIVEAIYGRANEEMQAVLGRQTLDGLVKELPPAQTILRPDLKGQDPDDSLSEIPYEKGSIFMRLLEESFGRKRFDAFLRGYMDHFAFHSITTEDFTAYLKAHLFPQNPGAAAKIPLDAWLYQPGLPADVPNPHSALFDKVDAAGAAWLKDGDTAALPYGKWSTQERLRFLLALPEHLSLDQMKALDEAFHITEKGNAEVEDVWLLLAIQHGYAPADARLRAYMIEIGRRKLIVPLYQALAKTPEGKAKALDIYKAARPGYHPIAQGTVDGVLGYKP
ncbi:MAG TPA: M1 family metallopeptidase [Holophagaceae bacterium]|nr:M1 family metallopeptidase [Holophagaceae bacterium]